MDYVYTKYVYLLSSSLRNFKKKGRNLYNFSCCYCGDSKVDSRKARGYLYENDKGTLSYKCHNCGVTHTFDSFLKFLNPELYKQFRFERFKNRKQNIQIVEKPKIVEKNNFILDGIIDKVELHENALDYLNKRKIPKDKFDELYYTNDINKLKSIFKNYDDKNFVKEPRIVLPVYSINNSLIGVITRSLLLDPKLRYINLRFNSDDPFVFNLNKVNMSQPKFILEGAFDSFFVDNSIAIDGADFIKAEKYINKEQDVLIFDNNPMNRELIKQIDKMVNLGYNIMIWPNNIKEKDINEMIQSGYTKNDVIKIIKNNVFNGLMLKLRYSQWKRI